MPGEDIKTEWISVDDRLPEFNTTVIVNGGIAQYRRDEEWYSLTAIEWPGRIIVWKVTDWMELPEPAPLRPPSNKN